MKTNLRRRVALVTGSTRGLGRAIATALAQEGANVIINGRESCDVTDSQRVKEFIHKEMRKVDRLDILVNNVGNIETFGRFEDLTEEDWQRSFNLTFMSAVRFIKGSLPYLKKSDQARIINIASLSAHQPSFTGLNPHYGMAKAGMVNLTKNLAADFGGYGIMVNTICPSTLAGGGWDNNVADRAKRDGISIVEAEKVMHKEENIKSPLGRMGELKDVAGLVVFLASANAGFLTGHCYNVDGGITRGT